jgi:ABC-2 type transport system permease protein
MTSTGLSRADATAPNLTAPGVPTIAAAPTFAASVAAEWAKLTSLRSTHRTLALYLFLSIGAVVGVSIVAGITWKEWSPADQSDFDPALSPLIGTFFTWIFLPVLSVKTVTSEFASGMMRLTLTATPRRHRVLLGKAVVVAAISVLGAAVATIGMFVAAQIVFAAYGLPTASLADVGTLRVLAANSVLSLVLPLIGLALAVVIRGTVGAVLAVFAFALGPDVIGSQLPDWWHDDVARFFPGSASDSVVFWHTAGTVTELNPLVALVVLAAWLAVFLGGAHLALDRRDV